jgi:glycopeptide antibiotics resistance protein
MSHSRKTPDNPRRLMWLAALVYTAFVIYGSLVPLEFRAIPWDEAVAQFAALPFRELGMDSRVDWATNLLLFIPLTFLWMGALIAGKGLARTTLMPLLLIPAAIALSIGIEFTQLFFLQRTTSQNDIFAESLGGIIGVLVWWGTGRRFLAWLQAWQQNHARTALAERLAWGYLAGVMLYNVLPLDLTISPVEIFHQWRSGMVNLVPFGRLPADAAGALYELATDVLIWVPLALLWRLDGTRGAWHVWGMTLGTAALLEFVQLFVYSRVSDVTDLFTAAAGAALGVWIGGRLVAHEAPASQVPPWSAWLPFALAAGWVGALMFVFWFPFDFHTDGAFIKSRLDFVQRVPFEVYYTSTEYRAVTEMLRKTLFFAPLGGLLAWGVMRQPWRWRGPLFVLAMLVLAGVPAAIEGGQLMLAHKVVDLTDWLLAWLGGLAGYAVARRVLRAPWRATAHAAIRAGDSPVNDEPPAPRLRWYLPLMLAGMSLLFWGASQAAFVPYNVRELFWPDAAWLTALLLALTCGWLAVWPVWLARRRVSGIARLAQLPLGLLAYGVVSFLLLRSSVPEESLFDLVGSPVLDWPQSLELGLRWVALAAMPGAVLYLAAQTVRRWRGRQLGALHFWAAALPLALAYWGVVAQAATDNLIELIATPRPLAFAALCAGFYIIFLAAALLASPAIAAHRSARWSALALSLPLAAICFYLGLAGEIDKYGQQFSALQFLLSSNRQHYASLPSIWLRYVALHVLVVATLALLQWPYFRAVQRYSVHAHL